MEIYQTVYFVLRDFLGFPEHIKKAIYHYDNCAWDKVEGDYRLPKRITNFNDYFVTEDLAKWVNSPKICKCGKELCSANNQLKLLAIDYMSYLKKEAV